MSTINEKFFADLSTGATWSAGVAFKRSNPLPLDRYSVFASKAEAITYATTNAVAYPGQVIAVVEENKMGVYVLAQKATETKTTDENGEEKVEVTYSLDLQEISPEIDLSEYATFDDVEKAIEEIVIPQIPNITASDDDVVDVEADGHNITVSHAKKGPEGGFNSTAEAAEVTTFGGSASIKVPAIKVDEYGHVSEVAEKEFKVAIPALPEDKNTEYTLEYATKEVVEGDETKTKKYIQLKDDAGAIVSEIDAAEFIKDGMLTDVAYDADSNSLTFVWNTESGIATDTVTLTDILDPYTAGAKIAINGTEISHVAIAEPVEATAEAGTRKYITEVETDGYGHIIGYKTAIETVVDTDTTYDISASGNQVTLTPSEGEATTVTLDVYTKSEVYTQTQTDEVIRAKISEMTGGESAADVLGLLNDYKASNDREVWGDAFVTTNTVDGKYTPNYEGSSRIDNLEAKLNGIQDNAQVNLIDNVEETEFEVLEKKLHLKAVALGKVTGLEDELNKKLNKEDINKEQFEFVDNILNIKAVDSSKITGLEDLLKDKASISSVSDLTTALNDYKDITNTRLEALEEAMTWGKLN